MKLTRSGQPLRGTLADSLSATGNELGVGFEMKEDEQVGLLIGLYVLISALNRDVVLAILHRPAGACR